MGLFFIYIKDNVALYVCIYICIIYCVLVIHGA